MRSGVIAQKIGMTRVFTDAGEHVPVTVLKLANVQVIAQRTEEKNGYTAVQLGAGTRKASRLTRAERQNFAVAKVEPKRKVASSGDAREPHRRGRGITADHFVKGQRVDVTGTTRQGLPGPHEALEFSGLRAPRRVGGAPQPRLDRPASGPGKVSRARSGGHMGAVQVTTQTGGR